MTDLESKKATDILNIVDSNLEGLNTSQVKKNYEKFGSNILSKNRHNAFEIFARQFKSSLIYLLIAASLLSFFLKDFTDGFLILAILLINSLLGFIQEYRSEKTIDKLSKLISTEVLVKREGKLLLIDISSIVVGDIIILREGDIVPADSKIIEAENLEADESQLTGESIPVTKIVDNNLFAGSIVEKGIGTAVVYAIGDSTRLGKIASLSQSTQKITNYEKSLQAFSSYLVKITLFTLGLIFIFKLVITQDMNHIPTLLLFIIALATAVVPEALPVIAIVTLSEGALKLAKKHVVVKRLTSLEDLGNVTVLCTDKTGTLTQNNMTVKDLVSEDKEMFQKFAYLSSEVIDEKRRKIHDSYNQAFLSFIPQEIITQTKGFRKIVEIPFDPTDRRKRFVFEDKLKETYYLVSIGAPNTLLSISTSSIKKKYLQLIKNESSKGLRHLGIAYKEIQYSPDFNILNSERNLIFLGFTTFYDPLRPTVLHTLEMAEKLGLKIKILTGDNKEVAAYVGRQVGLITAKDHVYSGEELERLSPDELKNIVINHNVFAQMTPSQKYKIIETLKENNVVAYQGDGINDAPALKLADVAIAVDSAADVAKENSDIILLKKDLEVIINGIKYGRAIFLNINKYIKYTMVGNFGNFFALATLYILSVNLPLLPLQILLTSLITDVPLITISSDHVGGSELIRPEKYNIHSLMFISLILGSLTAFFELIFFTLFSSKTTVYAQTGLFLYLTFLQLIVIFSIRNKDHFWASKRPSLLLSAAIFAAFLFTLTLPYFSLISSWFSLVKLSFSDLSTILLMVILYILILDFVKVWYYRQLSQKPT